MKKIALSLTMTLILFAFPAGWLSAQEDGGRSEFMAGLALEYRPEGAPDYPGAAARYQAAAAQGSREALLALARLSRPGGPLWTGADHWRERLLAASRAGWPEPAYQLAEALENKIVTGLAPVPFYFQAASAGHGPAALRLGQLYLEGGAGLPRDQAGGALWLTVAAENHEEGAALALGRLYYDQNPDAAARWLEKTGSPEGSYLLGNLYLRNKRFIEAVTAYTVAADQHYAPAHLALGLINLDNDFGRKTNPREALKHFKVAAQADLPEGAYRLARMYLTGTATPKDSITGAFWLNRAAVRGHAEAKTEFDKLVYNFTVGQKKRLERMIEDGVAPTTQTPAQK